MIYKLGNYIFIFLFFKKQLDIKLFNKQISATLVRQLLTPPVCWNRHWFRCEPSLIWMKYILNHNMMTHFTTNFPYNLNRLNNKCVMI